MHGSDLVWGTREPASYNLNLDGLIRYGASPRATLALAHVAKGYAFIQGRAYVVPEDVKTIAYDVLRHRVSTNFQAQAEGKTSEDIIQQLVAVIAAETASGSGPEIPMQVVQP